MGFNGLLSNLNEESGSRIKGYESSLDRLRALSKTYEEQALAPQKTDPWDVLSGALVQFTPALLGYGLGGRQGAITGLQAGGTAFESFNKSLEAKDLQERELAARRFESNQKEIGSLEDRLNRENDFLRNNSLRIERDALKSADVAKGKTVGEIRREAANSLFGGEEEETPTYSQVVAPEEAPTTSIAVESPEYVPDVQGSDTIPYEELEDLDDEGVFLRLKKLPDTPANKQAARDYFNDPKKLADYANNERKLAYERSQRGLEEGKSEVAASKGEIDRDIAQTNLNDKKAAEKFYATPLTYTVKEKGKDVTYNLDTNMLRGVEKSEKQKFPRIAAAAQTAQDALGRYYDLIEGTTAAERYTSNIDYETPRRKAMEALVEYRNSKKDKNAASFDIKDAEAIIPSAGDTADMWRSTVRSSRVGASASTEARLANAHDDLKKDFKTTLKTRFKITPEAIEQEQPPLPSSSNTATAPNLDELLSKPIPPRQYGSPATNQMLGAAGSAVDAITYGPRTAFNEILPELRTEAQQEVAAKVPFLDRATIKALPPQEQLKFAKEQLNLPNARLKGNELYIGDEPLDPNTLFSTSEIIKEVFADNPLISATALGTKTYIGAAATGALGAVVEEAYKSRADGQEIDPMNIISEAAFNVASGRLAPDAFKAMFKPTAKAIKSMSSEGMKTLKAVRDGTETPDGFIAKAREYVSQLTTEERDKRAATAVSAFAKDIGLDPNKLKDPNIRSKLDELMKLDEIQYIVGKSWTEGGTALKLNQLVETIGPRIGQFYDETTIAIPLIDVLENKAFKDLGTLAKNRKVIDSEYLAAGKALADSEKFLLGAFGFPDKEVTRILNPANAAEKAELFELLRANPEKYTIPVKDLWTLTKSWEQQTLKQKAMETTYDSGLKAGLKATSGLRGSITTAVQKAADAGDEAAKQLLSDNNIYKNLNEVSDLLIDKLYVEGGKGSFKPSFYLPNVIASIPRRILQMSEKVVNNTPLGKPIQGLGARARGLLDNIDNIQIPALGGVLPVDSRLNAIGARANFEGAFDETKIGEGEPFGDPQLFEPEQPGGGDIGDIQDPRQLLQDTPAANLDISQIDPNVVPQPQPQEPQVFGRDIESFGQNLDQIVGTFVPPQFVEQTMDLIESPSLQKRLQGISTVIQNAPRGAFAPSDTGYKSEVSMQGRKFLVNPQDQSDYLTELDKDLRLGKIDATYIAKQTSLFNEGAGELLPPPEPKQERRINLEQSPSDFGVQKKKMTTDNDPKLKSVIERVKQDPIDYAVMMMESGGKPKAKNPTSSASGLFQLISSTAKNLGVDDVFDPEKNYNGYLKLKEETKRVTGRDDLVTIYGGHYLGTPTLSAWLNNKPLSEKQKQHVQDFIKLVPKLRKFYNEAKETITV
jgi:hypothetical protein